MHKISLLQGKPDKEKIGMLKALPLPPPAKIILGMMHLSAEADAFKLLKPIAKESLTDSLLSRPPKLQRRHFFAGLLTGIKEYTSDEEEEEEAADRAQRHSIGSAVWLAAKRQKKS
ncbi:hypothetical protein EMIHUDRAFT_214202 [Emiliania huxleyi CCMP1516]|nr:hypothetical protein EMIHUDRAFT_214202 [Emiliania huxleyi CCMP1516]EOD11859.1 hypothetical protein EMIHUDRAFT_214202 [Emiliania huxleyi CCMP1516]|eukprot:XP_005764288.1 hypothetical protein EMIHUDRAFT_214202 [Emiliania huxleyi CCMP1516]